MNKKQKHGLVILLIGIAVVLVGAAFWAVNNHADEEAGTSAAKLLAQVETKISSASQTASAGSAVSSDSAASGRQSNAKPTASGSSTSTLSLPEKDGCIGILELPSLGIKLPIQAAYTQDALKTAPCRYTSENGEISRFVICGHNYRRHFGSLRSMQVGSRVTFTNLNGTVYQYTVSEVTEIASNDFEALKTGDWDLSLFTCNFTGQKRVLVRCRQTA